MIIDERDRIGHFELNEETVKHLEWLLGKAYDAFDGAVTLSEYESAYCDELKSDVKYWAKRVESFVNRIIPTVDEEDLKAGLDYYCEWMREIIRDVEYTDIDTMRDCVWHAVGLGKEADGIEDTFMEELREKVNYLGIY